MTNPIFQPEKDILLDRLHQMNSQLSVIKNDVETMKKYYDKVDAVLERMGETMVSSAVQEEKLSNITRRISDMERLIQDSIASVKTDMNNAIKQIAEDHKQIREDLDDVAKKVDYIDRIKWKVMGAIAAGGALLSIVDISTLMKLFIGG